MLARQLFSGHIKGNGKPKLNAFLASSRNNFGISLDRWSQAPERLFKALAIEAAKHRTGSFKGFALFAASSLNVITITEPPPIVARGVPTRRNPFHGDIQLPPDRDDSYYLWIATEIVEKIQPTTRRYHS